MSETRDAFGPLLLKLQAEVRAMGTEIRSIRAEIATIRPYIDARAGETELLIERLFDALNRRMDQTEQSVEERLTRIEARP